MKGSLQLLQARRTLEVQLRVFEKQKQKKSKKNQNETIDQTYDQIKGTAEADIEPDVQSGADEPKYVDQEPLNLKLLNNEEAEKTDAQPDEPVLQNPLGQNSVPKKHGKNISENIGNYDANNRTAKKYKKIIIPSTPVSEDSYGYSTPTELEIMAEKARNNIITEAQYIGYEKKIFSRKFHRISHWN
ncbi:hypothetical protein AYI70_g4734 [Smittium culicis]|uniref:Uncharacterized protein n=1 Tax=Smittium culicis TaxID=133412 RepID=A0A1R1XXM5_9FUNG|nr:hypothetical protein AYI70_g4734 [Smittium culicis]